MGAPNTISNLVWWCKADSGVYSDIAKTTPCVVNGFVAAWADQLGLYDLTQSGAGAQPTYKTGAFQSRAAISFPGGAGSAIKLLSGAPSIPQPYTIVAIYRPIGLYNSYNCLYAGNAGSGVPQFTWAGTSQTAAPYIYAAGAGGQLIPVPDFNVAPAMFMSVFNGTSSFTRMAQSRLFSFNDQTGATGVSIGAYAAAGMVVGNYTAANYNITGDLFEIFIYSRALTTSDMNSLVSYYQSLYSWPPVVGVRGITNGPESIGYRKGICLDGMSSLDGEASMGRHLACCTFGQSSEGNPAAPSLPINEPGFWRFRWGVKAGARTISIFAKQVVNGSPRPSMKIKKNPALGIYADVETFAPSGSGWVTIGPTTVVPTSNGVLWVELWNNYPGLYNTPTFFDHIVAT